MSDPNPKVTTAREREPDAPTKTPRPEWYDPGIDRECDYEIPQEEK
jgi:hypothetical protein